MKSSKSLLGLLTSCISSLIFIWSIMKLQKLPVKKNLYFVFSENWNRKTLSQLFIQQNIEHLIFPNYFTFCSQSFLKISFNPLIKHISFYCPQIRYSFLQVWTTRKLRNEEKNKRSKEENINIKILNKRLNIKLHLKVHEIYVCCKTTRTECKKEYASNKLIVEIERHLQASLHIYSVPAWVAAVAAERVLHKLTM